MSNYSKKDIIFHQSKLTLFFSPPNKEKVVKKRNTIKSTLSVIL